jgi:hypothetical protein
MGGEPEPDVVQGTPSPEPTVGESPLSPPATPTPDRPEQIESPLPEPEVSPIATAADPAADVVAAAREVLAGELGIPTEEVRPVLAQPVEWSDASLGCPESGKVYAQVITPGYRVVLRVGEKEYELHTDQNAQRVVVCERRPEEARAAIEHLAAETGISADEVEVLSVQRAEWSDTSLGCPESGRSYAQVVVSGYSVVLRARGEEYEVHTDEEGLLAVICEPGP